ncbi:hypothetical protein C0J52_05729 [Blattella germanica]|nr:hypothetical protein C0J52_05729 [Blattella germanica]
MYRFCITLNLHFNFKVFERLSLRKPLERRRDEYLFPGSTASDTLRTTVTLSMPDRKRGNIFITS